jgi:hypothetical protein
MLNERIGPLIPDGVMVDLFLNLYLQLFRTTYLTVYWMLQVST